jgi:hypothetical protein
VSHSLDQERLLRRRWPGISAGLCLGGPPGAHRATAQASRSAGFSGKLATAAGYPRPAPIGNPIVRLGFALFGRRTQQRFYRNIQVRITDPVGGAQRGRPLPSPAVRADGIVLAPSGARPHPLERLAYGWTHPGS